MDLLVTGGNGYIGRHLLRKAAADERIESLTAVTRAGSSNQHLPVSKRIKQVEYDGTVGSLREAAAGATAVLHLGALYNPRHDEASVRALVDSNLRFSVDLLQAVAEERPESPVISASTFSAFNSDYKYEPKTFYAATKAAVEVLAAVFPLRAVFLRLGDTYGPQDWRTKVHNLLRDAVLRGDEVFPFQKPSEQGVNLTHVEDVARAFLHSAREFQGGERGVETYDLFPPQNLITLGEVAQALIAGSKTSASFPLFGEVEAPPPERSSLPNFWYEHCPHYDLARTLYSEEHTP